MCSWVIRLSMSKSSRSTHIMVLSPATVPMISDMPLLSIDEAVAQAKPCLVCMMQMLP